MAVPAEPEEFVLLVGEPTEEPPRADPELILERASALRARLQRARASARRVTQVEQADRGLSEAITLYAELPGDTALRVLKVWSRTVERLLGR